MDPEPAGADIELPDHDQHRVRPAFSSEEESKKEEDNMLTQVNQTAASTSSASPSRAPSAPPPARPSTPAGRSSSGSSRSASAGRRSSGCRSSASPCSSTSPSCSTASSSPPLSSCGPRRRSRSCCPRSPWNICRQTCVAIHRYYVDRRRRRERVRRGADGLHPSCRATDCIGRLALWAFGRATGTGGLRRCVIILYSKWH